MGTLPLWGALLGLVLVAVVLCPGHQAIDAIVLQGALTICEIPCGCALMSIEAGRCSQPEPGIVELARILGSHPSDPGSSPGGGTFFVLGMLAPCTSICIEQIRSHEHQKHKTCFLPSGSLDMKSKRSAMLVSGVEKRLHFCITEHHFW